LDPGFGATAPKTRITVDLGLAEGSKSKAPATSVVLRA
jgi:hypothetical protein